MTITYYEHRDCDGKPVGPRARFYGTERYGYKTLHMAIRYCPMDATISERHASGSDDWGGRCVAYRGRNGEVEFYIDRD